MAAIQNTGAGFMQAFQPFADASFNQAKSRLDPQWQQNRKTFEQNMVNRGIMPGNEAYTNASESMGRAETDAYDTARRTSLADALSAQGQGFNQDLARAGFDFQNERADMSDLMGMLGYGQSVTNQNNQTLTADQQRAMSLLSLIPGMSPTPIDPNNSANLWTNQYNNALNNQTSKQNAQYNAWAQLGSAFLG
jgi:hypothetical protein